MLAGFGEGRPEGAVEAGVSDQVGFDVCGCLKKLALWQGFWGAVVANGVLGFGGVAPDLQSALEGAGGWVIEKVDRDIRMAWGSSYGLDGNNALLHGDGLADAAGEAGKTRGRVDVRAHGSGGLGGRLSRIRRQCMPRFLGGGFGEGHAEFGQAAAYAEVARGALRGGIRRGGRRGEGHGLGPHGDGVERKKNT